MNKRILIIVLMLTCLNFAAVYMPGYVFIEEAGKGINLYNSTTFEKITSINFEEYITGLGPLSNCPWTIKDDVVFIVSDKHENGQRINYLYKINLTSSETTFSLLEGDGLDENSIMFISEDYLYLSGILVEENSDSLLGKFNISTLELVDNVSMTKDGTHDWGLDINNKGGVKIENNILYSSGSDIIIANYVFTYSLNDMETEIISFPNGNLLVPNVLDINENLLYIGCRFFGKVVIYDLNLKQIVDYTQIRIPKDEPIRGIKYHDGKLFVLMRGEEYEDEPLLFVLNSSTLEVIKEIKDLEDWTGPLEINEDYLYVFGEMGNPISVYNLTSLELENEFYIESYNFFALNKYPIIYTEPEPEPTEFITYWYGGKVTLPLSSYGNYNFTIDWGDGTPIQTITSHTQRSHTYATAGYYTIVINGTLEGFNFNWNPQSGGQRLESHIIDVIQWGSMNFVNPANKEKTDIGYQFNKVYNLQNFSAIDSPNLKDVSSFRSMFERCWIFNGAMNHWNVSTIVDMGGMFESTSSGTFTSFNQPLNDWDVSNVKYMDRMFKANNKFNQPLDKWNTSNVVNMDAMFYNAFSFNQDINNWNVSNVESMSDMFNCNPTGCKIPFDYSLEKWNVSKVTSMEFRGVVLSVENYDKTLYGWAKQNISNVGFSSYRSKYCLGEISRDVLKNDLGWSFSDGGKACSGIDTSVSLEIISPTNITYDSLNNLLNITSNRNNVWYNWNGTNVSYIQPLNITFNEGAHTLETWVEYYYLTNYSNVNFTIEIIQPEIEIITPINKIYGEQTLLLNITSNGETWYNWNGTKVNYTEPVNITFPYGEHVLHAGVNTLSNLTKEINVSFKVVEVHRNLFALFNDLEKGTYYFNATVCNDEDVCYSTETRKVGLKPIENFGQLNSPINNSNDLMKLEINFTLNDIFTQNNSENIPVNIKMYLNESLIYNEIQNESQDICFEYNLTRNTQYELKVDFNYSLFNSFQSKVYYFNSSEYLLNELHLTNNTKEGVFEELYSFNIEAKIFNTTEIESVNIYIFNTTNNEMLYNYTINNTNFTLITHNLTKRGKYEFKFNATAKDINNNIFPSVNTKYLNITNKFNVCYDVNYSLNYSEGVNDLIFKMATWKQYGVIPINQTDKGTYTLICDDPCYIYLEYETNITGIVMKTNTINDYHNSIVLNNNEIYETGLDAGEHNFWLWLDTDKPSGNKDINITYYVCRGEENE